MTPADTHNGTTLIDLQALVDRIAVRHPSELVVPPRYGQAAKQRPAQFATNKTHPEVRQIEAESDMECDRR